MLCMKSGTGIRDVLWPNVLVWKLSKLDREKRGTLICPFNALKEKISHAQVFATNLK